MEKNQEIYIIDLPAASKKIVLELLKMGATCLKVAGTDFYTISFKNKSYNFYRDFTPSIPYMWGIVLSRKHFWIEMLKSAKIRVGRKVQKDHKKLRIFITKNYYYNSLLLENIYLEGDGYSSIAEIVASENLKRINSNDPLLVPLRIYSKRNKLNRITKKGERILISDNYNYGNITRVLDNSVVKIAERVIDTFPGLDYICFEIFIKDYEMSNSPYSIGNILISPGVNMFAELVRNKQRMIASELIVKNMLSKNALGKYIQLR